MSTTADGSRTPAAGLNSNASARLKMVVLAPIPRASDRIAVTEKIGLRPRSRTA